MIPFRFGCDQKRVEKWSQTCRAVVARRGGWTSRFPAAEWSNQVGGRRETEGAADVRRGVCGGREKCCGGRKSQRGDKEKVCGLKTRGLRRWRNGGGDTPKATGEKSGGGNEKTYPTNEVGLPGIFSPCGGNEGVGTAVGSRLRSRHAPTDKRRLSIRFVNGGRGVGPTKEGRSRPAVGKTCWQP